MATQTAVEKRKRILTLDILRGGFLVAIIVDHLNQGPSLWYLLTGGGAMWVSPAEGFFAISGILVGYILRAAHVAIVQACSQRAMEASVTPL